MNKFTKLFGTALILSLTSCAELMQPKLSMDTGTDSGSLSDFIIPPVKITKLNAPDQLFASQGQFKNQISLSWNAVENATSYIIERAVVKRDELGSDITAGVKALDETAFETKLSYTSKTTFEDTILIEAGAYNEEYNNVYIYRVAAENRKLKLQSDFSDYKAPSGAGIGWLLAPPKNVEAWKGKSISEIRITWTKNQDAAYYYIYRGKDVENMEKIDTVYGNQTEYVNQISSSNQGVEFYYKIEAVTNTYAVSAKSGEALGYALKEGAPTAPSTITVQGLGLSTDSLSVSWDSVTVAGAESVSYSVYRNSSEDSVYSLLKAGLTTNSFTDNTAKPSVVYYYYVQTVAVKNSDTLKSPFSETGADSETPARGFLLSPPAELEAVDSDIDKTTKVKIRWKPATGEEYLPDGKKFSYNVYYNASADGLFTSNCTYSDFAFAEGYYSCEVDKQPFYKITSVNTDNGKESNFSIVIAPMPDAPKNVYASKTEKIPEVWVSNENGVYPVKVTWEVPDADPVPYGYIVYRSTKLESGYRKISDDVITGTSFIDVGDNFATVKPGVLYFYKVVSVNSLEQGKKSNNPAAEELKTYGKVNLADSWGYGAITRDYWFRQYNKTVMHSQTKLTLMHKTPDTAKLGSETIKGDISGTLGYKAAIAGLGADITMPYQNYADYYVSDNSAYGIYFFLNGNTDTSSDMSGNGNMSGTVVVLGMYPAEAYYNTLQIKGGAAGGGGYGVLTKDLNGNTILEKELVDWKVGEEGR